MPSEACIGKIAALGFIDGNIIDAQERNTIFRCSQHKINDSTEPKMLLHIQVDLGRGDIFVYKTV